MKGRRYGRRTSAIEVTGGGRGNSTVTVLAGKA
jgi:hypothetical protein